MLHLLQVSLTLVNGQIISSSPERFFHARDRWIETRPIKGTRRRTGDLEQDRATAEELLSSEKDRSENVMIVDLLRNDLSRICDPHSMQVEQLCKVEEYPFVLHLVSVIGARLRDEFSGPMSWLPCFQAEALQGSESPSHGDHCRTRTDCSRPQLWFSRLLRSGWQAWTGTFSFGR